MQVSDALIPKVIGWSGVMFTTGSGVSGLKQMHFHLGNSCTFTLFNPYLVVQVSTFLAQLLRECFHYLIQLSHCMCSCLHLRGQVA